MLIQSDQKQHGTREAKLHISHSCLREARVIESSVTSSAAPQIHLPTSSSPRDHVYRVRDQNRLISTFLQLKDCGPERRGHPKPCLGGTHPGFRAPAQYLLLWQCCEREKKTNKGVFPRNNVKGALSIPDQEYTHPHRPGPSSVSMDLTNSEQIHL